MAVTFTVIVFVVDVVVSVNCGAVSSAHIAYKVIVWLFVVVKFFICASSTYTILLSFKSFPVSLVFPLFSS